MKPDAGKERDKQRLAGKKAKKAAQKAQREAERAPASSSELQELEDHIKRRSGSNRRAAFAALAAVDADRAFAVVEVVARTASGKTLQQLGALLLSRGDAAVVDAAAAGRFGELPVWEHAPNAIDAAAERLRLSLAALKPEQVVQRARSLGVVPLREAARGCPQVGALLVALLDDDRLLAVPGVVGALCEHLLELDAPALWARRDRAPVELRAVAGFALGYLGTDAAAADAFAQWLEGLPPSSRTLRLHQAALPASATRLPVEQRVRLLRLVFLDEGSESLVRRGSAAAALLAAGTPQGREVVLSHPLVNVSATIVACAELEFEEAWAVIGPHFSVVQRVRDCLLETRHARHPGLLDAAVALLSHDPRGALAFLARSEDVRAREEIANVFSRCSVEEAAPLLFALAASSHRSLRDELGFAPKLFLTRFLSYADGGPRPDRFVDALRALKPRAGDLAFDVERALARLERRPRR